MTPEQRLANLSQKHAYLEGLLRAEQARTYPDDRAIKRWKLEKLKLKDEMERLRRPH